jgi:lipoprotein-anchoring transpeptidase ErfK/SrfK
VLQIWFHRLVPVLMILIGVLVQTNASLAARVEARVDLKAQQMIVKVDGAVAHVWKVSTARRGYVTPRGVYGPKRMHTSYYSKKYYNASMPYSIFFKGGYAVHGTTAVKALGGPASHGCIRLATAHAKALYNLVRSHGPSQTRIIIS